MKIHFVLKQHRVFLLFASSLFISFLALDAFAGAPVISNVIKYCGIIGCFILALGANKRRGAALIKTALALTLVCDFVLLFFSDYVTMRNGGILLFCFAQTLHFLRAAKASPKRIALALGTVAALGCVCTVLAVLLNNEVFIPALYALCIIAATARTALWRKHEGSAEAKLALIGMALFVLCDVCVALFNAASNLALTRVAGYLIWVFYLPSQAMLALSLHTEKT